MLEYLLEPFSYEYMQKAMWISAAVGGICAFLSAYLMLKGWSLIGDALSHSVVPGVAIAYAFSLPYALGAFFAGILAALSILWIKSISKLKEDAVIGFIFLNPTSINVQNIILGNILGIADEDIYQVAIIMLICLVLLLIFWKDLLLIFFDETQAITVGLSPLFYKVLFFTLLSACVVAALQTVGAILVIAMVITPGATGGVIVTLQTLLFLLAFLFSPKYGLISQKRRKAVAHE